MKRELLEIFFETRVRLWTVRWPALRIALIFFAWKSSLKLVAVYELFVRPALQIDLNFFGLEIFFETRGLNSWNSWKLSDPDPVHVGLTQARSQDFFWGGCVFFEWLFFRKENVFWMTFFLENFFLNDVFLEKKNLFWMMKSGPFLSVGGCERTPRTPPGYGPVTLNYRLLSSPFFSDQPTQVQAVVVGLTFNDLKLYVVVVSGTDPIHVHVGITFNDLKLYVVVVSGTDPIHVYVGLTFNHRLVKLYVVSVSIF